MLLNILTILIDDMISTAKLMKQMGGNALMDGDELVGDMFSSEKHF